MADAEKTAPEQATKQPEDEELSLTVASKSGFNDRAWNDPPPALISGQVGHRPSPTNTPRPKLTARVGYDAASKQGGSGDASKTVLDPKGPPPKSGFVQSPRTSDST